MTACNQIKNKAKFIFSFEILSSIGNHIKVKYRHNYFSLLEVQHSECSLKKVALTAVITNNVNIRKIILFKRGFSIE